MKLLSSNKKSYSLIIGLLLVAALLYAVKTKSENKDVKYPIPPSVVKSTDLDLIQISLNEKSYNKLKEKRDRAMAVGILETTDSDYVPAMIGFKGKNYKAEIRLKGDWTDHLKDDKWSFRIKLKGDKTIMGMRKFSVHRPGARGFINEWLYHKTIKEADLIGLRYGFLEGAIQIKKKNSNSFTNKIVGIYAIEESFDKRTIESNKRKESVILKFSEDNYWGKVKSNKAISDKSGYSWTEFMDYKVDYPITVFGESKVLESPALNKYFKLSKNLLDDLQSKDLRIDEVFDVKELAMQNAILNLFGATHGIPLINVRFYYNPITSKLEPIAFDGNSGAKLQAYKHFNLLNQKTDSIYLKELAYALEKVTKKNYIDNIFRNSKEDLDFYTVNLKKEYKYPVLKEANIRGNRKVLLEELRRLKGKYNLTDIVIDEEPINALEVVSKKVVAKERWKPRGVKFEKGGQKIKRIPNEKGSYVIINDLGFEPNSLYQVSLKVKNNANKDHLGIRMQGVYPNRADAVIDLNKAVVRGKETIGGIELKSCTVDKLKNGWLLVKFTAKTNEDKIKVVFGPTDKNQKVPYWEKPNKNLSSVLIDTSSLTIVKVK